MNPLNFPRARSFFKYLPTASGIRIMSYALFARGGQFVRESSAILASWVVAVFTLFFLGVSIGQRKNSRANPPE
jgi:hypothetical protein